MAEHIENARALNRQACDDINQGQLDAAKDALNEAIRLAPDLAAPHTNLSIVTRSLETIDALELHVSPIGVPVGVSAVWCEFVD